MVGLALFYVQHCVRDVDSILALPAPGPSLLKQHTSPTVPDFDIENVDPSTYMCAAKDGVVDFSKTGYNKTPHFSLNTRIPSQDATAPSSLGRKRKADDSEIPPTPTKRRRDPVEAPIHLAGRSPPRKTAQGVSRRKMRKPVTRIDPPGKDTYLPFSLNAALAGSIPRNSKKKGSKKGWDFRIYEDSPQDEMANLMEHSTCTLDISDDESRASKGDRDNKENIPPPNSPELVATMAARRPAASQEPRSPLNDLDVKEFYANGCDTTSVFIIPADEDVPSETKVDATKGSDDVSSADPVNPTKYAQGQEGWEGILAKLSDQKAEVGVKADKDDLNKETLGDVHIWESESAKAEEEARNMAAEVAA